MMSSPQDRGGSVLTTLIVIAVLLSICIAGWLYYSHMQKTKCDRMAEGSVARLGAAVERLNREAEELGCKDFVPKGRHIRFMVGPYYGWGGTDRSCSVLVRSVGDEVWACSMLGQEEKNRKDYRSIYRISLHDGSDLPTTAGHCRGRAYGGDNASCYTSSMLDEDCKTRADVPEYKPSPAKVKECRETVMRIEAHAKECEVFADKQLTPFTLDLYHQLIKDEKNLFFSPIGAYITLAQLYQGAAGDTRRIMAQALHLQDTDRDVLKPIQRLEQWIGCSAQVYAGRLDIENRIWGTGSGQFTEGFERSLQGVRSGRPGNRVDLHSSPEEGFEVLRGSQSDQPKRSGSNRPKRLMMHPDTRLVLLNKISFNCKWGSEFDERKTVNRPFFLLNGDEIQVPTMTNQENLKYVRTRYMEAVEIPYKGYEISLVILLPRENDGLPELEKALDPEDLNEWIEHMRIWPYGVIVYIPRFEWDFRIDLKPAYEKLGLSRIFCSPYKIEGCSKAPDFSRMTGTRGDPLKDLFVSGAEQLGWVEISEEGTIAYVETILCSQVVAAPGFDMPTKPEPIIFRADHPFLYLVRHNPTGCIVFMGRVMQP